MNDFWKPQYAIFRESGGGFVVRIWRWWWPFWEWMSDTWSAEEHRCEARFHQRIAEQRATAEEKPRKGIVRRLNPDRWPPITDPRD